ncbi:hypothetical protein NO004_530027 [Flavobacterium psychrophilum]|uniref:hypothetical protein n=1 Tax=Flavobacterium psychrophilum TaxID=96345 RepID=UPI000B7C3E0E|nr:hypothetical protein [Flavobacterium psychrophilum]SNB29775.1 hypothetical protein NO004_530027 [Flavobacterium psychrophilum]
MKIYFKKYKYTHQIFYSSLSGASVEITTGTVILDMPLFPKLNGTYFIEGEVRKTESKTTYQVYRLGHSDVFFIDIHQDNKKISIYNEKLEGIILKT